MADINVSIIIPIYKTEKYLRKCINSLLKQTLDNIEIILVDDGSPDNSQKIISEYINQYPDKIVGLKKKNEGLGSARNYGIDHAKGKFLGFIDSDDYVKESMYKKLYDKAISENSDLVICEFDLVNEHGIAVGQTSIIGHDDLDIKSKLYAHKYGRTEAFNKLYNRDLFLKTQIRFPTGWFEDYPTIPLLIETASNISYVDESLMFYLQRKDSIMGKANNFSYKNFDILTATERIVNSEVYFKPENYLYYLDQIAPIHAFIRFYRDIIQIPNSLERNKTIKEWGNRLNKILPNWNKSTAIKLVYRRIPNPLKKLVFLLIIKTFRNGKSSLLYLILRLRSIKENG